MASDRIDSGCREAHAADSSSVAAATIEQDISAAQHKVVDARLVRIIVAGVSSTVARDGGHNDLIEQDGSGSSYHSRIPTYRTWRNASGYGHPQASLHYSFLTCIRYHHRMKKPASTMVVGTGLVENNQYSPNSCGPKNFTSSCSSIYCILHRRTLDQCNLAGLNIGRHAERTRQYWRVGEDATACEVHTSSYDCCYCPRTTGVADWNAALKNPCHHAKRARY